MLVNGAAAIVELFHWNDEPTDATVDIVELKLDGVVDSATDVQ